MAGELPREPSTLLVRLMAGGPQLAAAIDELMALPPDAYERVVATPALLQSHLALAAKTDRDPEEEELYVATTKTWEDAKKEILIEGEVVALRKLLVRKFGELPSEFEAQLAAASPAELDRYLERVLFADSLAAIFA